jgi:CBS domain-containing protein
MNATPTPAATTMHRTVVGDAMHPGIIACGPTADITEVAQLMTRGPMHCIAVVGTFDEDPRHLDVRAIVSDSDLLKWAAGPRTHLPVAELPCGQVITVTRTTSAQDAAAAMAEHAVDHVLVTESDQHPPLGILSARDVAQVLAATNPDRPPNQEI